MQQFSYSHFLLLVAFIVVSSEQKMAYGMEEKSNTQNNQTTKLINQAKNIEDLKKIAHSLIQDITSTNNAITLKELENKAIQKKINSFVTKPTNTLRNKSIDITIIKNKQQSKIINEGLNIKFIVQKDKLTSTVNMELDIEKLQGFTHRINTSLIEMNEQVKFLSQEQEELIQTCKEQKQLRMINIK